MKSTCPPHRWLIDTPAPGCNGIVQGTCRKCGIEKPHHSTFIGDRDPQWNGAGGNITVMRGAYAKRKAAGGYIPGGRIRKQARG